MSRKSKGYLLIGGLLLIVIVSSIVFSYQKPLNKTTLFPTQPSQGAKMTAQDQIWVISDIHFLEDSLFDDGEAFQFIKQTSAGKELNYQKERMEALVWQVAAERPQVLIVSGDLTLNGEKASAQALANYFQQIRDLGTLVYVIPGNHDIADGWARKYQGSEKLKTAQILPNDFSEIFKEMGYQAAFSRDEDSLSYAVKPFSDVLIVMLDTNKYVNEVSRSAPQTSGSLRPKTKKWLNELLAQSQQEELFVIPVMHHNLIDHNEAVNKGFTLDQASEVQALFMKYQVPVVLTGHIHAQDIVSLSEGKQKIYDIATGGFSITSASVGRLTKSAEFLNYQRKSLLMEEWAVATNQTDPNLLTYHTYSQGLFLADGEDLAYRQMFEENWFDQGTAEIVAEFVGRMNVRFFSGLDFIESPQDLATLKEEPGYQLLSEHPTSFLFKYIDSILADQNIKDTELTLPIK